MEKEKLPKKAKAQTEKLVSYVIKTHSAIKDHKNIKFIELNDIKGQKLEVDELKRIVDVFKHSHSSLKELGMKTLNRNIIVTGQQGSGKSNLAYSLANELGYPTKVIHCSFLVNSSHRIFVFYFQSSSSKNKKSL